MKYGIINFDYLLVSFARQLGALIDKEQISLTIVLNIGILSIFSEEGFGVADYSSGEVYYIFCHIDCHVLPKLTHLTSDLLRSSVDLRDSIVDDRVVVFDEL